MQILKTDTYLADLELLLAEYIQHQSINLTELVQLMMDSPLEQFYRDLLGIDVSFDGMQARLAVLESVYPALKSYKDNLGIRTSLLPETFSLYIPLALFMAQRSRDIRQQKQRAVIFGINGGQGSGKTTISAFLQMILNQGLGMRAVSFSIDDAYKTYAQRQQMAEAVHPLFAIRSVAGTHDVDLAMDTLNALAECTADQTVAIPRFDKMAKGGEGDRLPESAWTSVEGPVDVVIFEGWFVGAKPQANGDLLEPINQREKDEDSQGIWRKTMNQLLATDYQELFDLMDDLIVIQVRSMEDVYRNRELQEQHLRDKLAQAQTQGIEMGESGAMTPAEVVRFISLYERTTRHMLKTLPEQARVVWYLGDKHKVQQIRINHLKE